MKFKVCLKYFVHNCSIYYLKSETRFYILFQLSRTDMSTDLLILAIFPWKKKVLKFNNQYGRSAGNLFGSWQ